MKNNKINSAKKLILYVEDEEFQAKLFSRIRFAARPGHFMPIKYL